MHARIPLAICIATLFANTGLVHAQDGLVTLDSVVVIGERVQPEAVAKPLSVINSDELSRRQASNLGETLRGATWRIRNGIRDKLKPSNYSWARRRPGQDSAELGSDQRCLCDEF